MHYMERSLSHLYITWYMMTSSNGSIFRVTGPLCGEFIGHRWIPHTKASDAELWCFFFICAWINGWVNNHETGDLKRRRAHYNVIVMIDLKTFLHDLYQACLAGVKLGKQQLTHFLPTFERINTLAGHILHCFLGRNICKTLPCLLLSYIPPKASINILSTFMFRMLSFRL